MIAEAMACAAWAVSVYAALVLIAAGMVKLRAPMAFEAALSGYRLLPGPLLAPVARALPPLELVLGAALLVGIRLAGLAAAGLLLTFAGAVALNLVRGRRDLDCGCGTRARIGWGLAGHNAALAAALAASQAAPSASPMIAASGAALGAGVWLAARILAMMTALARPSSKRV